MLDLEAIKARAEAATAGPWGPPEFVLGSTVYGADGKAVADVMEFRDECSENRDFIAHARADVPALVAEVERLRDIIEEIAEVGTFSESASNDMWRIAKNAIAEWLYSSSG